MRRVILTGSRRKIRPSISQKSVSTVQLSPDNDANPARELSDRPKFNVVIIYEDRGTGRRAKYFYENLVHELKGECLFSRALELPGSRNFRDWEFGCASRSPRRFRHSFLTRQIWTSGRPSRAD